MSKRGGRKKPLGGPAPCRAIDYASMIPGKTLTNRAIERYALAGRYGEKVKAHFEQLKKSKSNPNRQTKCETLRKHLHQFIDSPKDVFEDTSRTSREL